MPIAFGMNPEQGLYSNINQLHIRLSASPILLATASEIMGVIILWLAIKPSSWRRIGAETIAIQIINKVLKMVHSITQSKLICVIIFDKIYEGLIA
jgi:hypothetical protein